MTSPSREPVVRVDPRRLEDDPYPVLRQCAARGPVVWVPELDGWLVTGYREASGVLSDAATFTVEDERFSTARLTGPSMLTIDGARHRRHRQAFAAAFRPRNVTALTERLRQAADRLVTERAAVDRLDVGAELARPLAAEALAAVLDLPAELTATLHDWHRDLVEGFEADDGSGALLPIVRQIRARLGHPEQGPGFGLDEAEYAGNIAIMLVGGIETVEGMIGYAARYRYGHPLGRDAPLDAVIEESLRLEPAAARLDRYATADVEVGGVRIERGDLVIVSLTGAHRDPSMFDEPEAFRPQRWADRSVAHLGFAVGPHFCLGAHLARVETSLALAAIDRGLPGAQVRDDARDVGLIFRRPAQLVLGVA